MYLRKRWPDSYQQTKVLTRCLYFLRSLFLIIFRIQSFNQSFTLNWILGRLIVYGLIEIVPIYIHLIFLNLFSIDLDFYKTDN